MGQKENRERMSERKEDAEARESKYVRGVILQNQPQLNA